MFNGSANMAQPTVVPNTTAKNSPTLNVITINMSKLVNIDWKKKAITFNAYQIRTPLENASSLLLVGLLQKMMSQLWEYVSTYLFNDSYSSVDTFLGPDFFTNEKRNWLNTANKNTTISAIVYCHQVLIPRRLNNKLLIL